MGWFLITEIDIRCSRSVNKVFKGTDTHTTNKIQWNFMTKEEQWMETLLIT